MRFILSFIILFSTSIPAISETVVEPDCGISRADIHTQLNTVSSIILQRIDDVEYAIALAIQTAWSDYQGDQIVRNAVDNATEQIYLETDLIARVSTIWNRDKAKDISEQMTLYTFGYTPMRNLVSQVVIQAQQETYSIIETISVEVSEETLKCLQERIDRELPELLAEEFYIRLDELSMPMEKSEIVPQIPSLDRSVQILVVGTIGGIVARRILRELPKQILRYAAVRIPAGVVKRAIPYLGLVLAAIDIKDAVQGFVPAIRDTLKREAGVHIRDSIGTEIKLVIRKELPKIAAAVADEGYDIYRDFMDRWNEVISLTTRSDELRAFLNDDREKDLAKIADLVSALLVKIGQDETIEVIESGLFEKLYSLPKLSFEILKIKDPEETLAWVELAVSEEMLTDVVEKRIFVATSPDQFENREHLQGMLELGLDLRDLRKIVTLSLSHQRLLLELPIEDSREIIRIYKEQDDLSWLLSFISDLPPINVNKLLFRLKEDPTTMNKLRSGHVADILLTSSNFGRHLDYVILPDGSVAHTIRVITGDIPIGLVPSNDEDIWVVIVVGIVIVIVAGILSVKAVPLAFRYYRSLTKR